MEARVNFHPDIAMKFGDIISNYRAWQQYVTEKKQVEVFEVELSQTQAS